ncbi:MAG: glycogen/starch synthase [Prevotellaceae bacterium]|jgi:glycosyltransferase involved in cell wall biosynthesis|nr:glycogen/starch synthase [Prevotellaceae bacterium]
MDTLKFPEYIFETSWEVCNKVGGIYTVLSTRAYIMQQAAPDRVFFIGPDLWQTEESPDFIPSDDFADWVLAAATDGLKVRVGRWQVEGTPFAILVDITSFADRKNAIYQQFWERFGVDSLHAYDDYDTSSLFGYAAGKVVESFLCFHQWQPQKAVAHFNEWMTGFGLLYLKIALPEISTLFTTHATTVGRSIAGNGKLLYKYFSAYNGDRMAQELNVVAKHSVEKAAALQADCFTTVSAVTNKECIQFLGRTADIITPNGFNSNNIFKHGTQAARKRRSIQIKIRKILDGFLNYTLPDNVIYIGTSGRYEYANKGIDMFIDVMSRLRTYTGLNKFVALITVPAWTPAPDTCSEQKNKMHNPYTLYPLMDEDNDPIVQALRRHGFENKAEDPVKIFFIPTYLSKENPPLYLSYYDMLTALDLTIYPSYYEPWGYTPMESAAFHVPTITTSLSGFGQWISDTPQDIEQGISVVERSDDNYEETVDEIIRQIGKFLERYNSDQVTRLGTKAQKTVLKATWEHFFIAYRKAYHFALSKNR